MKEAKVPRFLTYQPLVRQKERVKALPLHLSKASEGVLEFGK
jgi:hypothetical protein